MEPRPQPPQLLPQLTTPLPAQVLLRGADGAHAPGPPARTGAAACPAIHPGPTPRGEHPLNRQGQGQDQMPSVA